MASTFKPNHAAQMRETYLDVIGGLDKPGAVALRYRDLDIEVERIGEFDSLVSALIAQRQAVATTAHLMAHLFPKATA